MHDLKINASKMLEYIDSLLRFNSAYKCVTLHCSVVFRRSPNSLNTKFALIFLSGTAKSSENTGS